MAREPIPVVFVSTVYEGVDTGPATYAHYLWEAFRDDPEVEFHVVAPEFAERHPRLHAAGTGGGSLALYRRVQEAGLSLAAARGARTIVHGNSTHSMARFARYGGPWMVQVNDYETARFPHNAATILLQHGARRALSFAWRYREERRALRSASLAVCNSEYTSEAVRAAYGIDPARLRVIHKAVHTEAFERPLRLPRDPLGDRVRGGRLVFVGSDWRRKGLDVLLQALREVATGMPDVSLVAIGPDPGDRDLQDLLAKHSLQGRVTLPGAAPRELIANHLWHSDVFVLPSRREALGVAVLEALAAGLPVVATETGGIPEIVRSGQEGTLVPPDRPDLLAAALLRLLSDASLRETMSGVARRRASDFTVDRMIASLRDEYRALSERAASD